MNDNSKLMKSASTLARVGRFKSVRFKQLISIVI